MFKPVLNEDLSLPWVCLPVSTGWRTQAPWCCCRIPPKLRRGRCSKPVKSQIRTSSLEVSQNARSLLPCLEGGNSDIYSSCGQCELYCWWSSWKKENTENSVTNSLRLPETTASFCTKAKCLVINWIQPSNILGSLCYLASSEFPFPLISAHPPPKAQQTPARLH